jgi:hypothetical protein
MMLGSVWCTNDATCLDYQRSFAIHGDALSNKTGYARGKRVLRAPDCELWIRAGHRQRDQADKALSIAKKKGPSISRDLRILISPEGDNIVMDNFEKAWRQRENTNRI